ncbi:MULTISPECIES: hypothetical protein [Pseudomonas]|uniref:Uncharacterized protein n=1 Tax=Pseudomonas lurida TaxID=244566 RepID=A0ABY9FM46_9PSED|nr:MULTISPECIES: hypothetical protein [Pseudomonas]WLH04390.1 hypothetical protein PSH67_16175 [Pseudomonas lurida]WSO03125.1 hypothetical protein VUJ48_15095 [Pseudomonas lurida]
MKSLIAWPLAVLMLVSFQASALCLSIADSYTGIIPPNTTITAHGPFKITAANGCSGANIDATVSAGGAGRAPGIFIEQEVGSSWARVSFSIGNNASYSGAFGNYRVRLNNDDAVSKSYSGNVRYGR